MTMEGKICKTCGTSISQGAFLGLCAACSEGEGSTKTVAVTSSGNSTRWIVLGVVVVVLFVLFAGISLFSISDIEPSRAIEPSITIESSSSPVEAESPF